MDRYRYDLNEDELFYLNQLKRRTRIIDGKVVYRSGMRSNYVPIEVGDQEKDFDYAEILERITPFVISRYFTLNRTMLVMTSDLTNKLSCFLKFQPFSPCHMRPVKCSRPYPKRRVNTKVYPKCLVDLPKIIAMVDGVRRKRRSVKHSGLAICYGTKFGMPHATVTGVNLDGYPPNLRKIESNFLHIGRPVKPKEFFAVIARMLSIMKMRSDMRMDFEVPSLIQLQDALKSYDTASGYVPWSNGAKYIELDSPSQVKYISQPHKAKKKELASAIALYLLDNFKEISDLLDQGHFCTKPFFGESFNVEEFKWEILNCLEAGDKVTYEKYKTKLRLFFIESGTYTLLSLILLKPIHKFLIGGPFGLGLEINAGSFKRLAREMMAQGKVNRGYKYHLPRKDSTVLDYIYDTHPELIERVYIELDISAFDQSLLYPVLVAVALFYCMFYNYKSDKGLTRLLMSDMSYRLCVKYLHMLGMDRAFVVLGMMFSGKFETSTGNTIYQFFVYVSYIHHKLKAYEEDPKVSLLQVAFEYNLIYFTFQGDDLVGSYPKIFETWFNITYEDYKEWCLLYGLTIKKGYDNRPMIGESYFTKVGGIWEEEDEKHVQAVTFLKNEVCATYEDGTFVGIYPYRPAYDLIFRFGNSDKASEFIEGVYAKVLSLGMLTIGNIECYQYFQQAYELIRKKYEVDYNQIGTMLDTMSRTSNTFYQLRKSELEFDNGFPTLSNLRIRHNQEKDPVRLGLQCYARNSHYEIYDG